LRGFFDEGGILLFACRNAILCKRKGDIMPAILPLSDLKNSDEISALCHSQHEPVFITKGGHGDLVIMSMEAYDNHFDLLNIYRKLFEAEELERNSIPNIDGEDVFNRLRQNYGLQTI